MNEEVASELRAVDERFERLEERVLFLNGVVRGMDERFDKIERQLEERHHGVVHGDMLAAYVAGVRWREGLTNRERGGEPEVLLSSIVAAFARWREKVESGRGTSDKEIPFTFVANSNDPVDQATAEVANDIGQIFERDLLFGHTPLKHKQVTWPEVPLTFSVNEARWLWGCLLQAHDHDIDFDAGMAGRTKAVARSVEGQLTRMGVLETREGNAKGEGT